MCLAATKEEQVLGEMSRLAAAQIKGLGPAVASIMYFLHPTVVPPFNTAIINGYNALFRDKKKLGSWESYLAMREVIVRANAEVRGLLSKDLGAFAGLLFEIGAGRIVLAGNAEAVLADEQAKAEKATKARHSQVVAEPKGETEHTQMQYLLTKIGRALGYDVALRGAVPLRDGSHDAEEDRAPADRVRALHDKTREIFSRRSPCLASPLRCCSCSRPPAGARSRSRPA